MWFFYHGYLMVQVTNVTGTFWFEYFMVWVSNDTGTYWFECFIVHVTIVTGRPPGSGDLSHGNLMV